MRTRSRRSTSKLVFAARPVVLQFLCLGGQNNESKSKLNAGGLLYP